MTFDKGSSVLIEVEFKRNLPFGGSEYYDPPTPLITVQDSNGNDVLGQVNQALTQSTIGKYYYVAQTAVSWASGFYQVKVTAGDGTHTDITTQPRSFEVL